MQAGPDTRQLTLGADLRALRRSRGLTLTQIADALGRSVGWISQVERELSHPSADDLDALAVVLDVDPAMLISGASDDAEAGVVVRAAARRPIGHRVDGLSEELLSPDLTDAFEVVHSVFAPGARTATPVKRPTQELGFIVSGKLRITVEGKRFDLGPGDSFRIRGETFSWDNPHDQPCTAVWVIAPPVY